MDIHISFQHGPIEAEIKAGPDDDYQEVLNQLSDFVEKTEIQAQQTTENSTPKDNSGELSPDSTNDDAKNDTEETHSEEVTSLQDFSEDQLYRVIKKGTVEDGEIQQMPEIIGNVGILGENENKRALNGAVVLLTVLDDFHDISKVKTSELKNSLDESGIEKDAFNNVDEVPDEKVYINRRGRGNSATTELRYPGKQEGRSLINKIIDESL